MIEFDHDNVLSSINDLYFEAIDYPDEITVTKELLGTNKARINVTYQSSGQIK